MLCDGAWENLYFALESVGKPALMQPIPNCQGFGKSTWMWLCWLWVRPQRRGGAGGGGILLMEILIMVELVAILMLL